MLYFCSIKVRSKETPIGSVLGDVTVVCPPGLHATLFQWLSRLHRSSSGQNLDRNSHRVKNSSASKRTFNKDVQIIQHHLNDQRSADATTVGRPDLYEESSTCIMENFLSHSQEACVAVLEHDNSNDDENQYIPDTSCDLQSVETNCPVIRRSFLFGKGQITREETCFPLAFAMKTHGFSNQADRYVFSLIMCGDCLLHDWVHTSGGGTCTRYEHLLKINTYTVSMEDRHASLDMVFALGGWLI